MLGLILNDFTLIKKSFGLNFLLTAISLIVYFIVQKPVVLLVFVFMICLMIPCSSFNSVNATRSSNWNLVMDEFPVKREKVILSKYILFVIMSFVSILLAALILYFIPIDKFVLGNMVFSVKQLLTMYCINAQLMCILYYPLIYKMNTDKIDSVIMMAIGGSFAILYLIRNINTIIIFLIIILGFSVSFVMTCILDKKANR